MTEIIFALWFFAPGGFANMAPVIVNNIPYINRFNYPMDFHKTFRGKRIFGDHKTFRGLLSGGVVGALIGLIQMFSYSSMSVLHSLPQWVNYESPMSILLGASIGVGALLGDAVKSFFKRQVNIRPGGAWVPFDQIDFIVGGLVFSAPFVSFDLKMYVIIFIVMALLHPVINVAGWLLHLKSKPF